MYSGVDEIAGAPESHAVPSKPGPVVMRRVWLGLLIATAALLHFDFLTSFPLTIDEAFSWRVATQGSLYESIQRAGEDVHPPLYYLLLWGWIRVFGTSELAMRSLSGALSLATILTLVWYARLWGERSRPVAGRPDLLAAALVSLSLAQVSIAHLARMYAALALFTIASSGQLLWALRQPSSRARWGWYVFWASLALYAHNYAVFLVASHVCLVVFEGIRARQGQERKQLLLKGAGAFGGIALFYLPWFPWLLWQSRQVAASYWIAPLGWENVATIPVQFLSLPLNQLPSMPWYVYAGLCALTIVLFWPWHGSTAEYQLVITIVVQVAAIVTVNATLGRSVFVPRYVIHLLPLCAAPVAYWLCAIPDAVSRWAIVSSVLLVAGCNTISEAWPYLRFSGVQPAIWQAADALVGEMRSGEPVIVGDSSTYLVLRYCLERRGADPPCYVYAPELLLAPKQHVVFASVIGPEERWNPDDLSGISTPRFWVVGWEPSWVPENWAKFFEDDFQDFVPVTGMHVHVLGYQKKVLNAFEER
ncbi:MAG: glycosyltransferase family 39 protein [Acidobacteria bacterium]|nr:glycosyltransferase family 39 protein [Acidobacteriota bacterium]